MELTGGCICGAVKYRVEGEPLFVTHCHCLHCRRTNAAAFVTWAEFKARDFTFTKGSPGRYETRPKVIRTFCTKCGTQLTYQDQDDQESIDITVGSLDSADRITPNDHIWCDRMLPWVCLDDGLPRFPQRRSVSE